MATTRTWRMGWRELGDCLRHPEMTALRWSQRKFNPQDKNHISLPDKHQKQAPSLSLFTTLLTYTLLGMMAYGFTLQMHNGTTAMVKNAWSMPLTLCFAWMLAFPSLYIINTALGSRVDLSTTLLALLITLGLGSLAMMTLVPIHWFFSITLQNIQHQHWIHLASLSLVGLCMADVFLRIMRALEPDHNPVFSVIWILLVSLISFEMSHLSRLFQTI